MLKFPFLRNKKTIHIEKIVWWAISIIYKTWIKFVHHSNHLSVIVARESFLVFNIRSCISFLNKINVFFILKYLKQDQVHWLKAYLCAPLDVNAKRFLRCFFSFYDNSRSCGLWPQQIMCSLWLLKIFSWPFGPARYLLLA